MASMNEPPLSLALQSLSLTSSVLIDETAPVPEFVDPYDPAYLCSSCRQALRQACQTPCGHRLCQPCVDQLSGTHGSNQFRCPTGEAECDEMTVKEIRPDFSARRYVMQLRVYCSNKKYGCDFIAQWRKLKDHMEEQCKYNLAGCPNECGINNLIRSKMDEHLASCPRQQKSCMYSSFGCLFKAIESLLREHYETSASSHLEMMTVHVAQVELTNTRLQGQVEELNAELSQHKQKLARLSSDYETLQRTVGANSSKQTQFEHTAMKAMAGQNEGIIKLEQKTSQQQAEIQREITAVKEKCAQVERQIQAAMDNGGRRGHAASATVLPEEVRVQLIGHDRTIGIHDVRLAELDLRLQCNETTNYEGCLIWKITEYRRRKRDAVAGGTLSLYSQPFYTSRYGYKLCARVYLNGDGAGRGSHVSFFLVVMQGDYDELLSWPFRQRVTLCLLDQRTQRRHLADTFRPDPTSTSFQKPSTPMNVASGCPQFIQHTTLEAEDSPFLANDTLYFKISVDTSDLLNP